MCNQTGIAFGERSLGRGLVTGRDVLEVGALDVNGSLRPWVQSLRPARYVGVDLTAGPGVEEVVDATNLVSRFGRESFDLVITTEMVEHTRDWRTVVSNLKGVLRPGGHLLLTTRSPGLHYHAWPHDFWRYEAADMRQIFGDLEIQALEPDPEAPGVFLLARRPELFVERTPELALVSILTGRREHAIAERQIRVFMLRRRLDRVSKDLRRRGKAARRRLPFALRSTARRALGRPSIARPAQGRQSAIAPSTDASSMPPS